MVPFLRAGHIHTLLSYSGFPVLFFNIENTKLSTVTILETEVGEIHVCFKIKQISVGVVCDIKLKDFKDTVECIHCIYKISDFHSIKKSNHT